MRLASHSRNVAVWVAVVLWPLPSAADEPSVPWSQLHYRINKMLLSVQVEVEAAVVPEWSLLDEWLEFPEGIAVRVGGEEILAVQLRTNGLGQSSVLDLWADPYDVTVARRGLCACHRGDENHSDQDPHNTCSSLRAHSRNLLIDLLHLSNRLKKDTTLATLGERVVLGQRL